MTLAKYTRVCMSLLRYDHLVTKQCLLLDTRGLLLFCVTCAFACLRLRVSLGSAGGLLSREWLGPPGAGTCHHSPPAPTGSQT